jgi:predicted PhzF superfamily epimerase YddE/YHI9
MNLSILNAFTEQPFKGNSAAVCFLSEEKEKVGCKMLQKS